MADDEYQYEILNNENDARVCAQLIADVFCSHNDIAIYCKIAAKDFFEQGSLPLVNDVFDEGLSFLARHRSSGEIVGVVIANDLYKYYHQHPYHASGPPSIFSSQDFFEEMDNIFIEKDFGQELKPNLVLQVEYTATHAQHSGKSIATQLSKAVFNYARKEKGFKYVLVQPANPATRHIYVNKMGGKEVTIIDPTTWIWKKNSDHLLYPYKDYKHGPVQNVLIELK